MSPVTNSGDGAGAPQHVLYFCYGSNMDEDKFTGRAPPGMEAIAFSEKWLAYVDDWKLCFNLRVLPPFKPCVASLKPQAGARAYGVVYRIDSVEAWRSLLASEGYTESYKKRAAYCLVDVSAVLYKPGEAGGAETRAVVKTLGTNSVSRISPAQEPYFRPTLNYLELVRNGARGAGLPESYIAELEELKPVRRWNRSPLAALLRLCAPLYFMRQAIWMRILRAPYVAFLPRLYAWHERLMMRERRPVFAQMQLAVCRAGMFAFGALYMLPMLGLAATNGRVRRAIRLTGNKPTTSPAQNRTRI